MFEDHKFLISKRAFVVVIVLKLDLQLAMQLMPITTNVMSLNPAHGEEHTRYKIM